MSTQEKRIKTSMVMVRVSPEDHAALAERARDVNMTVPAYMVSCALGRRTRSQADAHILEELRRLGEQQRALHASGDGTLTAQYGAVLVEIVGAMRRLGA
ncbi:plasmid mobilization protein MobA [Rugamonas apoptosis]|uniref:Mobilization protein n=1 Tax=Rugamonas apoptosis TaxID=2758570 RepID=A0A7W2IJX9_9BURK|nr:plasmid mobilization protein MobA [Rugamonas apoptosis]MBA5687225.1 mobilization protein [Rugamonas apoptosis]